SGRFLRLGCVRLRPSLPVQRGRDAYPVQRRARTVKFLYKIHSGYDGFRPAVIHDRRDEHGRLRLGWQNYLDSVEEGSEVWVYFKGPHKFENGVYAKGLVEAVDIEDGAVLLGDLEFSLDEPLTDDETSERVAEVVQRWGQQVFVFPE